MISNLHIATLEYRFLIFVGLMGLFASCSPKQQISTPHRSAQYFRLTDTLGIRRADVFSPWQNGELQARYYLVSDSLTSIPSDGIRVIIPLQRVATTSATHVGFIKALNCLERIVALTARYTYNQPTQPTLDLGEDINLNMENLLLSHAQVIFVSPYGQNFHIEDRTREADIPVIYINEWKEQDPLARAEWLRFFGALLGEDKVADSILHIVDSAYIAIATQPSPTTKRSIVSGASFRGTWYVPSGASYMGRLFRDANAEYAFYDRTEDSSIPLSMEQAVTTFADADVWVGANATTYDQLRSLDEKQTWIKAFEDHKVFHFYKRQNAVGANDFWETGVVHPEIILQDLRWALYPETMPDYEPYFLAPLE